MLLMLAETAAEYEIMNGLVSCQDSSDVGVTPRADCKRCEPNHHHIDSVILIMQTDSS